VVRVRGRLQRDGHGVARPQSRGPIQLLLQKIQSENRSAARRPAHLQNRIHSQQEFHSQRHQAGQFSHVRAYPIF